MTIKNDTKTICTADYQNITRYGILNRYGDFWTPDVFNTKRQAMDAIAGFWNDVTLTKDFLKGCKIVPVKVTLEYTPEGTAI